MNLSYDLDGTEWMEEVAGDLAAFLMDADVVMFGMTAAANDNEVVVFHGDEAPAMVWQPKFMTAD